ncbi:hypothetical protein BCR36DRAFT_324281 [Piromyces finnis]|uniref:Protein YAE1 n=1 Tax=Piromyces finnis TaxID=1754191 RepID=A0A1Y1VCA5_9FUNG|nr:hypothetical protein BCR36DRAFT_324281 [Piromyces finnis]|eukprot:ORX52507.1 hypothetical protein BCR36DRAFT_324281 [Piromyces finnis]
MDDDIWDDCDDSEYDRIMSDRNYNRMSEINQNMGYIQGIDHGKISTIQESFEKGFKIGFDNGSKVGEQYGEASAMKFLFELENGQIEKVNAMIKNFDKYKNFKNVESLFEKEELKDGNAAEEKEEIFMPQEIKSFLDENKIILESI